jgi:acetolactate synthase I/II/III large subunit
MEIQVSQLIVRFLQQLGTDTIFGMPGAHILPVYDALYDSDIQSVLAKHEQGAAFMAGGLARATGNIGACITTTGPGATNLITGIANAYVDKLPVIAITGEVPTYAFGKGGLQESSGEGGTVDQAALFAGVTRYYKLIERTDYLASVLNEAAKHLRGEIPGPVVLSIPFNVQKELVDETILDQLPIRAPAPAPAPKLPPHLLKESIELLKQAESPLIVAGYGCIRSGAQPALQQLCERMNIPVSSSLKAKGALDEHSPLSLGSLGVTSAGYALQYLQEKTDLLILLGAGFNERTSYVWNQNLLNNKAVIQVDNNPHQLEKVFTANVSIQADLSDYLTALEQATRDQGLAPKTCIDIAVYKTDIENRAEAEGSRIFDSNFDLVKCFYRQLEQHFTGGIDLFDDNIVFAQNFYRVRQCDRFFPNTGVSSLGHAIPAAIGAGFKVERPVFALIGDGGFQMCAMEIMTAVNYKIPLTVVVFNNQTMGLIRKNQQQQYEERFINCDFVNPDFALLAKSFGITHRKIDTIQQCESLFEQLDVHHDINLVEVMLDQDAYPNYSSRR